MTECKAAPTPAVQEEDEKEEKVSNDVPYQRAAGCLMFLKTASRPDLAFAVVRAARVLDKPTKKNWSEFKRIFRYLQGTKKLGIRYPKTEVDLQA